MYFCVTSVNTKDRENATRATAELFKLWRTTWGGGIEKLHKGNWSRFKIEK